MCFEELLKCTGVSNGLLLYRLLGTILRWLIVAHLSALFWRTAGKFLRLDFVYFAFFSRVLYMNKVYTE